MDAHLPVDEVILAVAALLALGLIGTGLVERTPVPALLVSLAIGMGQRPAPVIHPLRRHLTGRRVTRPADGCWWRRQFTNRITT